MKRALVLVLVAGCGPELGAPLSLVTSARVVAVRTDPAEAAPGASVTATALVASPDGTSMPSLAWAVCRTPKPATIDDVVDPACLSDGATPLGDSAAPMVVALPSDGCALFGPELPPSTPGQPPLQPRAPDATGGYYQPVRVALDGAATIALARIRCALAGASMDAAAAYAARYAANTNPTLTPLTASLDGQPLALDAVPAGRTVTLTVGWTADSVESYPVLDTLSQQLVDHREAMTVSWLATAGRFAVERSGRGESDPSPNATNAWTAPSTAGVVHVWIVLRDSRGGVAFAAYDLTVE